MLRSALLGSVLIASIAGCVVAPPQARHEPVLTAEQAGLAGTPVDRASSDWWNSFRDPQLDRLIRRALQGSPTLAQANARLREALAQTDVARAGLLPSANLDGSLFRERAPQNYFISAPLAGNTSWMGQAGAIVNWNLDFWGRQAAVVNRAKDLAQASALDLDDTRLMLAAAVAQAYVELHESYALADIAQRSEEQRERIVKITRRRVEAGLDTRLELRLAEGALPQARVDRAQALAAADMAVHQLAAVTGQGTDAYASIGRPTLDTDAALPLPSTLPINLLARRPDVLAARLQIDAADAQRLAARAAFYPSVSLSAFAGIGAFGLDNLVSWSARSYGGGPVISLPLFDAGRLRAEYKGSEAQLDGLIASYNDTVLQAVRQTADQLTRIDSLARQRVDQQTALAAAEDAYRIGEERYRAGLANYLSVLNAETQVLAARRSMVDITANQLLARVMLLLAVGGDFDPSPAATAAALPSSNAMRSNP